MKKILRTISGLTAIQQQLDNGFWWMSSDITAFKNKVELLIKEIQVDMSGQEEDADETDGYMAEAEPEETGVIAIVPIQGEIVFNTNLPDDVLSAIGITDIGNLYNELLQIRDNPDISTVVLNICSPGGTTMQLNETYNLIQEIGQTKNVVAFGYGMLASAAYSLACAAVDGIYVTPSCIVGSVGSIYERKDISQALNTAGIKVTPIASSPKKTWQNPNYPMSDDEKAYLTQRVTDLTEQFKANVTNTRDIDPDLLDASVFSGTEAVKNKFADGTVDSLPELLDAITKENPSES